MINKTLNSIVFFIRQGYRQRTQIAKALKAHSQAIRTAVARYNQAAAGLPKPRPSIDVSQVLEYVFIGEFDLLRESRFDILEKPWARPAACEALSAFFKSAAAVFEGQ